MEPDLKAARICMGVHIIVAILIGWASPQLGNLYAALTGIILLFACGYGCERFLGKRGVKFWIANGVFIYLLIWLVSWIYFYNLSL